MEKREAHRGWHTWVSSENKSIWINKSSVNPKSTSNQSSKPCTVLQYPSRIGTPGCRASTNHRGGSSRCSRQKCRVFGLRYWQCVLHVPAALCLRVAVGVAGYCSAMCVLQCVCCSVCVAVCVLQYLWYSISSMEWLRLVGPLKSQISFAKEPYKRDDILQKRPILLRSLLIVAPP